MAKIKRAPVANILQESYQSLSKWKEQNPIIQTRYTVHERVKVWVDNEYGDKHGGNTVERFHFDTEEERAEWLENHDPDDHNEFVIFTEYRRLVTPTPYKEWFTY